MTNPTADAAKLLPCPFCGGEVQWVDTDWAYHVDCFSCCFIYGPMGQTKEQIVARWNTRPQPAPPEGEPDFKKLARDILEAHGVSGADYSENAVAGELQRMYRLGLAARPKIADAEVVRLIGFLRSKWHGATLSQTNEELMAQARRAIRRT